MMDGRSGHEIEQSIVQGAYLLLAQRAPCLCCSTDVQRAEEALATLLPLVPGVKYFRCGRVKCVLALQA